MLIPASVPRYTVTGDGILHKASVPPQGEYLQKIGRGFVGGLHEG